MYSDKIQPCYLSWNEFKTIHLFITLMNLKVKIIEFKVN